jgi:hypothetical protein
VAPQTDVTAAQSGVDVKFKSGSWTALVTVSDAGGQSATATADYRILLPLGPGGIVTTSAFAPAPDTLYAIPLVLSAKVGDEVPIVIVSGEPAYTFAEAYLALLVDADAEYVPNSFNLGDPGGAAYDTDGIWSGALANGSFLPFPDGFIADPAAIEGSTRRLEMGIMPLGPTGDPDFPGFSGKHGAICNLKVKFTTPGTKTLNFVLRTGVDRTFYQGAAPGYPVSYWSDISNSGAGGVPNSIDIS